MEKILINIKKIKERYEKYIDIIFWIAIALLLISIILIKPLNDLDEMWNYNFSKNIIEGRMPYRDFNIITMPLVPYIGAIFLFVFGNEMFSMRLFAIIINFSLLLSIYKLLAKLEIDKNLSKIVILGIIYLLNTHFRIDYNFFTLFLILIIINIETKNIENIYKINKKIDVLLGVLAGLCICSKQTIGICIAIVTLFYQILFVKNDETFQIFLKKFKHRFIGVAFVLAIIGMYFTIFDLWKDFVSYAILGIKEFSNNIPYIRLITKGKWYIRILSVVVPIYLIVNLFFVFGRKILKKELDINNTILLVYSWAAISVVFPIADEIHFLVGGISSIIGITYLMYKNILIGKKRLIFIETASEVLTIFIIVIAVINSISLINTFNKTDKEKEISHFRCIPNSSYKKVMKVDEFIKKQNKDVYILDANAALYTIPIDQYNKDYDMFNKGNLGYRGEERIILELKVKNNIQVLILQDKYKRNWQTPKKVIDYIKNYLNKIGSIEDFDIYEK